MCRWWPWFRRPARYRHRQPSSSRSKRFIDDLWTYEVDMAVHYAGSQDSSFTGNDFRRRADHQVRMNPVGDVGIPRLPEGNDPAAADAHVALHHAPMIEDDHVGDDEVTR